MGAYQLPPLCFLVMKTISKLQHFLLLLYSILFSCYSHRWSRGLKARGQGQGHKTNPRPRAAFPRTDPLEAKNGNARGQGSRTQPQVFSKKKRSSKKLFRQSPIYRRSQNFDWGDPNHKSHAMTSSKICLLALNQDFAKGEGLN